MSAPENDRKYVEAQRQLSNVMRFMTAHYGAAVALEVAMSASNQLKPCPFCGSAPKVSAPCNDAPEEDAVLNGWQIVCQPCNYSSGVFSNLEDASIWWNARAAQNEKEGSQTESLDAAAYKCAQKLFSAGVVNKAVFHRGHDVLVQFVAPLVQRIAELENCDLVRDFQDMRKRAEAAEKENERLNQVSGQRDVDVQRSYEMGERDGRRAAEARVKELEKESEVRRVAAEANYDRAIAAEAATKRGERMTTQSEQNTQPKLKMQWCAYCNGWLEHGTWQHESKHPSPQTEATDTEINKIMAQCRRGFPASMIDESNSLHAECYGTISRLHHRVKELEAKLAGALKVTTENTIQHMTGKVFHGWAKA